MIVHYIRAESEGSVRIKQVQHTCETAFVFIMSATIKLYEFNVFELVIPKNQIELTHTTLGLQQK